MPEISMPQRKAITNNLNEWLEELLCSSRNIEILAESSLDVIGKGDEDLRMREMTPEEGASLMEYARLTKGIMSFKRFLTVSYKNFYILPCISHFLKTILFFGSSFCFLLLLNDVVRFLYPRSTRP